MDYNQHYITYKNQKKRRLYYPRKISAIVQRTPPPPILSKVSIGEWCSPPGRFALSASLWASVNASWACVDITMQGLPDPSMTSSTLPQNEFI